jgi:hypothetical protein
MVVKIMKMFQTVERSYQDKKTGEEKVFTLSHPIAYE